MLSSTAVIILVMSGVLEGDTSGGNVAKSPTGLPFTCSALLIKVVRCWDIIFTGRTDML